MVFHFRNSFIAASILSLLFSSCGGSKPNQKQNEKEPDHASDLGRDDQNDKQDEDGKKVEFFSDIRSEEPVEPCQKGQTFAFEQCWDRLIIDVDIAQISLEHPGRTLTIFDYKQPLSNEIVRNYHYSDSYTHSSYWSGDQMNVKNSAIFDLLDVYYKNIYDLTRYWFLPASFTTTNQNLSFKIDEQQFVEGEFPLRAFYSESQSWYLNGRIVICGESFRLPIYQGNIEDACRVKHGDSMFSDGELETKTGIIKVHYSSEDVIKTDNDWIRKRKVDSIEFKLKDKT